MNILTNLLIISLITLKFSIISANIGNNNVENNNNNLLDDCKDNNEFNFTCQSARIMGNILKSIKDNNTPLILMPGLEIVASKDIINKNNLKFDGRSNTIDSENTNPTTFSGRLNKYLRNHELKIKFSELLDKNDFKETFMNLLDGKEVGREARRRPDRGMSAVMVMGLMMAKLMTTLGMGGIGALAMKALGVSMMALLLSGIIGLKSLAGGHDDGGHHVQYITAHDGHHRKRREILPKQYNYDAKNIQMDMPLPFRGWSQKNI